jgi:hypothetical protein
LLAGLFALNSAISFVLFRRAGSGLWLVAAGLNCLLAFASKETALFLPLTLLAYDLLFYQSTNAQSTHPPTFPSTRDKMLNWRFFLPSLAIVLLGAAFLSFRVSLGGGYAPAVKVTLPRLAMNLAYYVLIGVLALPNNYAFRAALPSWKTLNALPIVTLVSSAAIIITIGWIWFRERIWLTKHKKSLLFALVWAVGALAPVIFIVSERAVFMSSVGIALAFAILFIGAWDIAPRRGKGLKRAVAIAIVLYIGLNASVLRYRGAWWAKSAETSEAVLTQLDSQIENQPHGTQILLVGLPDHVAYTFTFRNTFPAAARVLQYNSDVKAILDTELTELSPQQQEGYIHQLVQETNAVVFWYRDGELVPEEN